MQGLCRRFWRGGLQKKINLGFKDSFAVQNLDHSHIDEPFSVLLMSHSVISEMKSLSLPKIPNENKQKINKHPTQ